MITPSWAAKKIVGRIYKEHYEARWFWLVNTSPFPAAPPDNGLAKSLEEATQQFRQRHWVKAAGAKLKE